MCGTTQVQAKRTFKDALFCDIFGRKEDKTYALELYNALRNTSFDDADGLEITTLENVLYLGRKNDVSFILGGDLELWEHQSTYNPNMPLRGLGYLSKLYDQYVNKHQLDVYHAPQIKLPVPHYVVFYNGLDKRPEREEQLLSTAFVGEGGDLELKVTVLNINAGYNADLMQKSPALSAYADFTKYVREYNRKVHERSEAVRLAIDRCIGEGKLTKYFRARRMEVEEMYILGEDQEAAMEAVRLNFKRQGLQEGREEGRKEGRKEGEEAATRRIALELVRDGVLSAEEASSRFDVPLELLAQ